MSKLDIIAALSYISGLSVIAADATFQSSVNTLFGPYASKIIAALGLASVIATGVLHIASSSSKGTS